MLTVGEILKEKRLDRKLTLEQVEKTIKIRTKFLKLIEDNNFKSFESAPTLRGFIRNYANFLGLSNTQIMAFYRRQSDDSSQNLLPHPMPVIAGFKITPQLVTVFAVGTLLILFVGFLISQYLAFRGSPSLVVSSPPDNLVVKIDQVDVVGQCDPDASLVVNGQSVRVDSSGKFKVTVPLTAGLNEIVIKATNKYQKTSRVTRHLRLEE